MAAPPLPPPRTRLSLPARAGLLACGGLLAGLLALAAWLPPNARGFGTHQALGLPACQFRTMFGMRCPSCGMTTAWSCVVRGNLWRAAEANAGGMLLAFAAIAFMPLLLGSGLLGRWLWTPPSEAWVVLGGGTIMLVTLVDWGWRLAN